MDDIQQNLNELLSELKGTDVKLVAVSKFHPAPMLQEAYDAGQRIFGESHVQELEVKHNSLPKDIQWHFIGHLQTNKVKYIAPYISLIHAVDTLKLLKEIDKQARKIDRVIDCLLQVHVAKEETKFGFSPEEIIEMCKNGEWKNYTHARICGLMCMATNTDDQQEVQKEFKRVRQLFDQLKTQCFSQSEAFTQISMGMSHDYPIAIAEGSTMIRVGSKIFGERTY